MHDVKGVDRLFVPVYVFVCRHLAKSEFNVNATSSKHSMRILRDLETTRKRDLSLSQMFAWRSFDCSFNLGSLAA